MGRGRRVRVGLDQRYKANVERIQNIRSTEQLAMFLENEPGPVADSLLQLELVGFNPDATYRIKTENIDKGIQQLRKAIVDTRELPREETERIAAEIGKPRNLTGRQVINAVDREYRAQAQAIRLAARLSGKELSPTDKRTLTQAEKSVYQAAYGSRGQFDSGTLLGKVGIARRPGPAKSKDPVARARARENVERLRETAGIVSASGRGQQSRSRFDFSALKRRPSQRGLSSALAQRAS